VPFPELSDALIAFDRPVEAFNPGQTTVDLFLFDVRENLELRSNEPVHVRVDGGVVIREAPLRVACSYLVTAWPSGGPDLPLQEHRLLSQALQVLSRHPKIPAPFLRGRLVGQEPPLPLVTARADGLKDPHEFWAAIGNKMRASIVVTATIGMDVFPSVTAPEVIATRTRLGVRSSPDGPGLVSRDRAGVPPHRRPGHASGGRSRGAGREGRAGGAGPRRPHRTIGGSTGWARWPRGRTPCG
jgi:hypothetical protein